MAVTIAPPTSPLELTDAYAKLEEQILIRDQKGASDVLYGLIRAGRPWSEMTREITRIHAPYTHVPYHQRLDDGVVKFVNNDHSLLSSRVGLHLREMVPPELTFLPLAQTVWYVPTSMDAWNQLLGLTPGHYSRNAVVKFEGKPPMPTVHWPDQGPEVIEGPLDEKLNYWLTLVQRGNVLEAYRVFLGLWEKKPNRERLLGHLVFAGLIDVQDRQFLARSYTTGHKSFRARATVEIARALGYDNARDVIYAGVPDIAVGPRWYSTYEMGCIVTRDLLGERDAELMRNDQPLTSAESFALIQAILSGQEPAYIYQMVELLKSGRGMVKILETIQLASAQLIIETGHPNNFSMPQHSFEYSNTLRWFYDTFPHKHALKLLFVAASFVNRAAHHQAQLPENGPINMKPPAGADRLSQGALLRTLDETMMALQADDAVRLTNAYLEAGYDRPALVELLATAAVKMGNDPHNQELGLCLLEDYRKSSHPGRDLLLLACAKHTAGHRKYGDPLEAYRRFAENFGIDTRQRSKDGGELADQLLDD